MFFILAVILIAISGILFILFFDDKPKTGLAQKADNRAIRFDQNIIKSEEVKVVFDEPVDVSHINITLGPTRKEERTTSEELEQHIETTSPDANEALKTNSKINPFNF